MSCVYVSMMVVGYRFLGCVFSVICIHGYLLDTCAQPSNMCVVMISSLYSNCVQNEHFRLINICDMCTQIGGAHSHTYSKVFARLFYLISFQSVLSSITKKGEIVSAINLR